MGESGESVRDVRQSGALFARQAKDYEQKRAGVGKDKAAAFRNSCAELQDLRKEQKSDVREYCRTGSSKQLILDVRES